MRWLLPTVAFLLLFAGHAEARAQVTVPIQVVLVVPSGYTPPYSVDQAEAVVRDWTAQVQSWWIREVGMTFDFTLTRWDTSHPLTDFSNTFDPCGFTSDIHTGDRVTAVAINEGIVSIGDPALARLWFVLVGGGGWAGGTHNQGGNLDYGKMLLGDWGIHQALLNETAPCGFLFPPARPGALYCCGDSYGHEILHTMDVDSHNPVVGLGDVLSTQQRRDLKNHNRAFLRTP